VNAADISRILQARHADAVCIPECKMGPSGSRVLDLWVMAKSWSPWRTIGYEIKVTRSDFLRDTKWPEYLDVCHELYFAAPPKVIDPGELQEGVGLMVIGANRGIIKRKAARREINERKLLKLMSYVLMSRHRTVADMWQAAGTTSVVDRWRQWLTEKEEKQTLGYEVRAAIASHVRAHCSKIKADVEQQSAEVHAAKEAIAQLRELGIPLETAWEARAKVRQIFGHELAQQARETEKMLMRLAQQVEDIGK